MIDQAASPNNLMAAYHSDLMRETVALGRTRDFGWAMRPSDHRWTWYNQSSARFLVLAVLRTPLDWKGHPSGDRGGERHKRPRPTCQPHLAWGV